MNTSTPAQQTAGLTATPWVVVSYSDKRKPIEIRTDKPIYDGASGTVLIAKLPHETVNPRANAAYIVQCVNGFAALQADNERLREDAENWRALMACRMRTLGGAKVNDPDDPWTYITMEFWTGHPDPTDQPWLAEHFAKFMAKARRAALTPRLDGEGR